MTERLLLIAGGTGGHIMPAITFGRWALRFRGAEIGYVSGIRPLEMEIYSSAGIEPHILNLSGSPLSGGVSLKNKMNRVFATVVACAKARKILKEFRPSRCVMFGGYISLPFLIMCKIMKIPAVLHEQNACAGMVTRLAAKLDVAVLTAWESCIPLDRTRFERIGIPVREFKKIERGEAMKMLDVDGEFSGRFVAVIFSGSLGSVSIKEQVVEASSSVDFKDWLFLIPAVSDVAERISANVWVLPKMWDPSPLFSAADCIVTRAGGSTLAEVAALDIPALVIPWKNAANNHQYHNAVAFLSENTGIILDLENNSGLLPNKLLELKGLVQCETKKRTSQPYNKVDKICEGLWEAISSQS